MHAENGSAIDVIIQQALAEGKTAPKYHALTRPTTAEAEAVSRAIALSEMAGAPIYIVHLSCNEALEKVREARDRGLPVYAETCPQYLYLSIENFDVPTSKAQSMSSLRRCEKSGIRKNSGLASSAIICRSSLRITVPSASKNRKNLAAAISPKFRTAARGSNTA